jgi:hypothetical protein
MMLSGGEEEERRREKRRKVADGVLHWQKEVQRLRVVEADEARKLGESGMGRKGSLMGGRGRSEYET